MLGALALVMLVSWFVIVEPAPYEACMMLLLGALLLAGLSMDVILSPLIVLIGIWAIASSFAVIRVAYDVDAVIYLAITLYMAFSSLIFACALLRNTERRLDVLLKFYVVAAVIASLLGTAGYLRLFPGAEDLFVLNGRASGGFKDPNVFGPFLILPLLYLVQALLYRGFRLFSFLALLVIMLGLFFSFSRGAWGHFAASAGIMLVLMFLTSTDPRFRLRLIVLSAIAVVLLAVLVAGLLSVDSIRAMFAERANLLNYYDAGEYGRFGSQQAGLLRIFEFPNGLGPGQFTQVFGMDPHNVYLAALYAYGWVGGFAYYGIVLTTLIIGLVGIMVRSPWQPALIAAYGTFFGVVLEGFIIDTDHWRHYFLLVGLVWGLSIAALRLRSRERLAHAV
ncbi:O-antigen ligase family protein [Terrihabitans sp. B22-R8]|uniref:O-antigen ligase family protein n=1 Tax=Terrihabitans sp. B22-R8 TaxID=3425128 RepID=UPI00403C380B